MILLAMEIVAQNSQMSLILKYFKYLYKVSWYCIFTRVDNKNSDEIYVLDYLIVSSELNKYTNYMSNKNKNMMNKNSLL